MPTTTSKSPLTPPPIDPWSFYDFKPSFPRHGKIAGAAPMWVGSHFRRIQAYNLLESYYRNSARYWLDLSDPTITYEDLNNRREYGDPYLIINTVMSSVIGEDQSLVIPEAQGATPDADAVQLQDILLQWMEDEKFTKKLVENERTCAKLGDMIYVIGWNAEVDRPKLRIYPPGMYFPVLDPDHWDDGFPSKVHIAWQYDEYDPDGKCKTYVTRVTWELVPLVDQAGQPATKVYPWNNGLKSNKTCIYSKGTWELDDIKRNINDFDQTAASWEAFEIDLEIDFIPVVHIPNTVAEEEHYGVSCLAPVMQLFDDQIATDTDIQASSATTGSPPIAVSGASLPRDEKGRITTYGPGTVWETGDGTATMIDTSKSLDALLKLKDSNLERTSVNARIPESLMGRVKPSEVPSGITLQLSFAPHVAAVKEMRLVRKDGYGLVFKFTQRFMLQRKKISKIFNANIVFGSFLPADKKEAVDLVNNLMNTAANGPAAISLQTAVAMLVAAGFPIEDAAAEVDRIIKSDFKTADEMLTVVGEPNPVRARLGLPPLPAPQEVPGIPPNVP